MANSFSCPKPPDCTPIPVRRAIDGNMPYTAKIDSISNAREIAVSALATDAAHLRLSRCRALLSKLDPDSPPPAAQPREFRWQYRALLERVHLYSECIEAVDDPLRSSDYALRKAETAVELSLQYFRNVLTLSRSLDGDGLDDDDA